MTDTPLCFLDHNRMDYSENVRISEGVTDFLIGDYGDTEGRAARGTSGLGEIKVVIHDLRHVGGGDRVNLTPQLCVFGDGTGALTALLDLCDDDLSGLLADVPSSAEFSRRLLDLGLRDRSDTPLSLGD